ncbi:MAG TPA: hypothetical protein VKU77_31630 [Streptosporangiaceae bacterium]|nr:hypothetical protein [Streptosporangiaceae bacterium]
MTGAPRNTFRGARLVGPGRASSELVASDAFQVRLRGYVSRSVRTFPSRPPKEPS